MLGLGVMNAAPGGVLAARRFEVAGLPLWSAAVRASQSGSGGARVLCIGDSTTSGFGSAPMALAWPRVLGDLLGGREMSSLANHNLADAHDPRMVRGAGWAANSSKTLGGYLIANSTMANAMVFTPQGAFDTVDLFLYGSSSVAVTIGSGTAVTVTGVGGSAISRVSVGVAQAGLGRGQHAVSVVRNGSATLCGLVCRDAAGGLEILNAGAAGWKAADFVGTAYSAAETIGVVDPDLVIVNIGINDYNQATPTVMAAWKASVQTVIDRARTAGADVLLVVPNETGGAYAGNRAGFAVAIGELAAANGLRTPVDLGEALGGYAAANAGGLMYDVLHPSPTGHGLIAERIRRAIT